MGGRSRGNWYSDRRGGQGLEGEKNSSGVEGSTALCPPCCRREGSIGGKRGLPGEEGVSGTLKRRDLRSASGTPHPALSEVSKGFRPLRPPNQGSRSCPHPTHTLTLALELADDGVQVSVLGRDVAPADRHLSAAASAWSHQRPGSLRLRLPSGSAASGSGRAPPPGRAAGLRAPPARLRLPSAALPGPPRPAARRASSPPRPPGSCPRRGAERSRAAAAGRGQLLRDSTGQGRGPDS